MVTTVGKHLNLLLDNVVCIPHTDCKSDSFRVMVTTVGKHLNLLLDNVVCIPHTDCKKSETITRVGTKVKIIFIIQLKPKALYTPCNTSNLRNK